MRNVDAALLLESFFIAAVVSFLAIRAFLAVTGYPQLGASGIHIAHLLWGGLLMLAALMLQLAYLDRSAQHVAAVVAGLGFGTFVDEIGKFVTADNDYFFRPAVAVIYVTFVATFLATRTLIGRRTLRPNEALANALALLGSTLDRPIEPDDRARIHRLLRQADPESELTVLLRRYVAGLPGIPDTESPIERIRRGLGDAYRAVMANAWSERALVVGVIAYTAFAVLGVLVVTTGAPAPGAPDTSAAARAAQLVSTLAGAVFVARGILSLHSSHADAYRWLMRGLLVWILITQVFVFYSSQLAGLGGLAVDLVAYGSLRFALDTRGQRHGGAGRVGVRARPGGLRPGSARLRRTTPADDRPVPGAAARGGRPSHRARWALLRPGTGLSRVSGPAPAHPSCCECSARSGSGGRRIRP